MPDDICKLCPECGYGRLVHGACPRCGYNPNEGNIQRLEQKFRTDEKKKPVPEVTKCPICGTVLPRKGIICPSCGNET